MTPPARAIVGELTLADAFRRGLSVDEPIVVVDRFGRFEGVLVGEDVARVRRSERASLLLSVLARHDPALTAHPRERVTDVLIRPAVVAIGFVAVTNWSTVLLGVAAVPPGLGPGARPPVAYAGAARPGATRLHPRPRTGTAARTPASPV